MLQPTLIGPAAWLQVAGTASTLAQTIAEPTEMQLQTCRLHEQINAL